MKRNILWIVVASLFYHASAQDPTKLAKTPPLGWNSWDCFGMDVTESQVMATADYMAKNMKSAGWTYIVIDMGWDYDEGLNTSNFRMKNPPLCFDKYGRLIPNVRRFPSSVNDNGFKSLSDYVHRLGLKFGIHIMRGITWEAVEKNTPVKGSPYRAKDIFSDSLLCRWYHGMKTVDMAKPGSQEYYNSLLEQYAGWEVDYIKADDMENPLEIEAISKAIKKTGRPIVLSLVGSGRPDNVPFLRQNNVNLWRIIADVWDDWYYLKNAFKAAGTWQDYIMPNHWPDLDMLPLGKLRINGTDGLLAKTIKKTLEETVNEFSRLTKDEKYTMLTLWSIFHSPLMIGGNLMELDELTLQMLMNEEVLAVNQYSKNNHELRATENEIIWTADDPDTGSKYVALFNISDNDTRSIKVTWNELGISGKYIVRDLWEKKNTGKSKSNIEMLVSPHGCGFYKVSKK
jgi:alpha-galactosidase